jgi:translation initiation factor IF-2
MLVEVALMGEKKQIGVITRYFHKIGVAAIMLEDTLKVGDKISIEGTTTSFEQEIASMQVNREDIKEGTKGQEIAIKVKDRVREKDAVFLV